MSLEDQIGRLTDAVEQLVSAISNVPGDAERGTVPKKPKKPAAKKPAAKKPEPEPAPIEAPTEAPDLAAVRAALRDLAKAKGRDACVGLLDTFGAEAATQLQESDFADFIAAAEKAAE